MINVMMKVMAQLLRTANSIYNIGFVISVILRCTLKVSSFELSSLMIIINLMFMC